MKLDKSTVISCTTLKERRLIWSYLLKNGFKHAADCTSVKEIESYSNYKEYPNIFIDTNGVFKGRWLHPSDNPITFEDFKKLIEEKEPFKVGDIITCLPLAISVYSYTRHLWEGQVVKIHSNGDFDAKTLILSDGKESHDGKTWERLEVKYFTLKKRMPKFELGDIIEIVDQSKGWGLAKKGDIAEVSGFYKEKSIYVSNAKLGSWSGEEKDYVLIRKFNDFREGDRVSIIKETSEVPRLSKGLVGNIKKIKDDKISINVPGVIDLCEVKAENLKLDFDSVAKAHKETKKVKTDTEVKEVKEKPKLKIGDRVRAINASYGWGDIKKGDIGIIISFYKYDPDIIIADFPNQKQWEGRDEDFELVDEEPVAKAKKAFITFGTKEPKSVKEKIIKPKTIKKEEKEMATKPTIIDRAKAATSKTVKMQSDLVQNAAVLEGARILGDELVKIAKKKAPMMVRGYIDTPFGKAALMNALLIGMETACPDLPDNHPYKQVASAAVVVAYQEVIQSFNIQEMLEGLFGKGDLKKAIEKIK